MISTEKWDPSFGIFLCWRSDAGPHAIQSRSLDGPTFLPMNQYGTIRQVFFNVGIVRNPSDQSGQVHPSFNLNLAVAHPNVRLDVGTKIRSPVNAQRRHTLRYDVVARERKLQSGPLFPL